MPNVLSANRPPAAEPGTDGSGGSPPLRVWGVVGIVALLVVLLPYPAYLRSLTDTTFTSENVRRIHAFTTNSAGAQRVIIIGNSVLHSGTFYDDTMNLFAATNGCPGARFLRVTQRGIAYRDTVSVMEPALNSKPDLLVVQDDMFLTDSKPQRYGVFLSDTLRMGLSNALGRKRSRRRNLLEDPVRQIGKEQYEAAFERYIRNIQRRVRAPRPARTTVESFLKSAKEKGVRVIVVEMPRPEQVRDAIKAASGTELEAERRWLRGCGLADHISCPIEFGMDHFRDFSHLNTAGRFEFARWFVGEISKALDRKSGAE